MSTIYYYKNFNLTTTLVRKFFKLFLRFLVMILLGLSFQIITIAISDNP